MKMSELKEVLKIHIQLRKPTCIWSDVGEGKSSAVRQICEELDLECRDVRASQFDAVDLRGLPAIRDNSTVWLTPSFLPTEQDKDGVLFLDELNRAPIAVMNAGLQLVLDGRLGDYVLPKGWIVLCACNPEDAGVQRMSKALSNRLSHLKLDTDLNEWCKYANEQRWYPYTVAFLRFRPDLLRKSDIKNSHAFPTPRSWEKVAATSAYLEEHPTKNALYSYASDVGEGPAAEYMAFLKLCQNLPNIDLILEKPDKAPIPKKDQPAENFAVACALARRATPENFERIVRYISRLPQDYAVMTVKDAITYCEALVHCKAYTQWSIQNADVFA